MKQHNSARSLRISLIYAVIAAIWIVLSDQLLALLIHDFERQVLLQTTKGLFFILSTASLIYFLLLRELQLQEQTLVALGQSEARWRSVVENAPDMILTVNRQGEILFINYALEGFRVSETVGTSIFDYIPPEHHVTVRKAIDSVFETGEPASYEITAPGPHGTPAWYATRLGPIKHDDHIHATILIARDISARKRAEAERQESEQRYQFLFENMLNGFAFCKMQFDHRVPQDFVYLEVNDAFEAQTGLQNVVGKNVSEVIPGIRETNPELFEIYGRVALTGVPERFETFVDALDMWFSVSVYSPEKEYFVAVFDVITHRKRAEEALREREERFRLAMENIPDVVVIYDRDLRIQFINSATTRLTGRPVSDFIGRQEEDLWPPEVYEAYLPTLKEAFETKSMRAIELDLSLLNGTPHALSITCVPVLNDEGEVREILGITHDFTERKQTQQAEREQRVLAEALADTATVLNSTLNLDHVLDRILANIGRVVPHDAAYIILVESGIAKVVRCWGFAEFGVEEAMRALAVPVADLPDLRWMADNAKPFVIPNTRTYSDWVDLPETRWASSYAGAPLFREGQVTGFLGLLSQTPGFFTPTHAARLQAFADQAGTALYNAQLFTEERDQRTLAQALRDTASALISALDLEAVMNTILENVARVVPHDAANIMLIEGDQARPIYWRGYRPEHIPAIREFRIPITETPNLHQMFETGIPFLVPHTDQYPDWVNQPLTAWVKSYVAAPIRSHGQVIGFLNLDSRTPDFFNTQHVQRLQVFADQASIAIEHAQLYDEIRRHTTELEQRVQDRTAQLNHTLKRIEAILNSSEDIIILCRTDSTIRQVNPAFDKTFKCEPDQAVFQPLTKLVVPGQVVLLDQAFQDVISTSRPRRLEITVYCEGQTTFEADVVLSPIIEDPGRISGVVCSLRDITERKRMEAQLRQMLEHEMELVDLKSRYVAMAAHDLRNPLAVIQSTTSLISQYSDRLSNENLEEKYERIRTSINVMVGMLDDILTLGKAESGILGFEPTRLDVSVFCETIVAETKQVTGAVPRIDLTIHDNCNTPLMDAKLLRHILSNLLANAVKYSPEDRPVTFEVYCEPDQIRFRVQDRGIGIPEDEQKRLFEAFYRASNTGRIPGTGLGLAIVKQSVELHGGTISFESEEGHGTTFTVIIPQTPPEEAPEANSGH